MRNNLFKTLLLLPTFSDYTIKTFVSPKYYFLTVYITWEIDINLYS